MIRRIIHIDEAKCNGCGLCADACHEGAIGMVDGKARLLREDYCDGLGDCLPSCPAGAITFEEREAPAYDHAAVLAAQAAKRRDASSPAAPHHAGCPGSRAAVFSRPMSTEGQTASRQPERPRLSRRPKPVPLPTSAASSPSGRCRSSWPL